MTHWQIVTTMAGHHARLVTDQPHLDGTPDALVWSEPVPDIADAEATVRAAWESFGLDTFQAGGPLVLDVEYVDERDMTTTASMLPLALIDYPTDPLPDLTGMPIPFDTNLLPGTP